MKLFNRKLKASVLRVGVSAACAVLAAGVLFVRINPTHITTAQEVEREAFQTLGERPGKTSLFAWLRARGFEFDESSYQKNGHVTAILRDTKWGVPQTDIHLTLAFDLSKLHTDNPECLGHSVEERRRIL